MNQYDDKCKGCDLSKKSNDVDVIEIGKYWTANHYGGCEGFLGWMAFQTRYHRNSFDELTEDELIDMGTAIKKLKFNIKKTLGLMVKDDPVERVYFLYLYESVYDVKKSNYHIHFHLIPRFKSFRELMNNGSGDIDAYQIASLYKRLSGQYTCKSEYGRFVKQLKIDINA